MATEVSSSYCGWPNEEISSRSSGQHISASKLSGAGSASFGRYEVESLLWEKRSVFNIDRRKEELETCRLNGLVTKNRAFFEEYYKKFRALQDNQQSSQTLDYRSTVASTQSSEDDNSVTASKPLKNNQKTENILDYEGQIASSCLNEEDERFAKLKTFEHEGVNLKNFSPNEVAVDNVVQNGESVQNMNSNPQSSFSSSSQYSKYNETSAEFESTENKGDNCNNFNLQEGSSKVVTDNVVQNGESAQIANLDLQTSVSTSSTIVKEAKHRNCPHSALHIKEDIKVIIHETVVTGANEGNLGSKITLFQGEPVAADQVTEKSYDNSQSDNRTSMCSSNEITGNPLESTKIVVVDKLTDSSSFIKSIMSLDQKNKLKYKSPKKMGIFQKTISKKEVINQQSKKVADKIAKKHVTIPRPFSFATEHRAKRTPVYSDGKSEVVPKSASRINSFKTHSKNITYAQKNQKKTISITSPMEDKRRPQKIKSAASESIGRNSGIEGSNSNMVGSLKSRYNEHPEFLGLATSIFLPAFCSIWSHMTDIPRLSDVTQQNKFELCGKDKTSRTAARECIDKEVMTNIKWESKKVNTVNSVACAQTGNTAENKKKIVRIRTSSTLLSSKKSQCNNLSPIERNSPSSRQEKPRWR